jgi:hypothetical protein
MGSTTGSEILESLVGWLATVPEFQRHPGSDTLLAVISFSEARRYHRGPNQASKEGGNTTMFSAAENCCTEKAVCAGELSW